MIKIKWDNTERVALIGDREIYVLASGNEGQGSRSSAVILYRDRDEADAPINALRWSVGCILELGVSDLALAKGSIETMVTLESADED